MRLGTIQLIGPTGQSVTVEASGERGLSIERFGRTFDKNVVDIRDLDAPIHGHADSGAPPCDQGRARLIAQVPIDWLILPQWEHTEPLKP